MCKCFVFPHFCWDPALCKDTSCQAPSDLPLSAMASEHPGDVGTGLPPSDPPLPFLLVFFFFRRRCFLPIATTFSGLRLLCTYIHPSCQTSEANPTSGAGPRVVAGPALSRWDLAWVLRVSAWVLCFAAARVSLPGSFFFEAGFRMMSQGQLRGYHRLRITRVFEKQRATLLNRD